MKNKELEKALVDFRKSAFNLLYAWGDADLSENYPFNESFDEVVLGIAEWIDNLKK